ncbi:hypothetical protein TWF225_010632 [Orbilia oligospora]|nr:hypothetical protein TWF225_010632 [Orbilia oligospora]KAF3237323.1 hypothetical protein TWF128_000937 [Orbilia oligospora]KAF3243796.1 hypothetical protein TWF217_011136 [Orbilia oligospora]
MLSSNNTLAVDYSKDISSDDLYVILHDSYCLGALSPYFENLPILNVIEMYADYITSVNGNITLETLVQTFGMRPTDAFLLISVVFAGIEDMANTITTIAHDIKPHLPHPTNPNLIAPLYITLTAFTAFIMTLRMFSRRIVANGIASFDWLALVGFLMTTAWGALAIYHSNVGGHYTAIYDRTFASIKHSSAAYSALVIMYPWTTMVIKLSLVLFYHRAVNFNFVRRTAYATAILISGTTVVSTALYANAYPHIDYWNYPFDSARVDQRDAQTVITCIFILSDLIIWILPMPLVLRLKLYPRERVLALYTFSVGGVVFIASGFRLQAIRGSYTDDSKSDNAFLINAWTIVELNLALIFASIPSVRALAIHYSSRISGSVRSPSSALDPTATTKPPTEKDGTGTGNGIVAANNQKPNAESQSARV